MERLTSSSLLTDKGQERGTLCTRRLDTLEQVSSAPTQACLLLGDRWHVRLAVGVGGLRGEVPATGLLSD